MATLGSGHAKLNSIMTLIPTKFHPPLVGEGTNFLEAYWVYYKSFHHELRTTSLIYIAHWTGRLLRSPKYPSPLFVVIFRIISHRRHARIPRIGVHVVVTRASGRSLSSRSIVFRCPALTKCGSVCFFDATFQSVSHLVGV